MKSPKITSFFDPTRLKKIVILYVVVQNQKFVGCSGGSGMSDEKKIRAQFFFSSNSNFICQTHFDYAKKPKKRSRLVSSAQYTCTLHISVIGIRLERRFRAG